MGTPYNRNIRTKLVMNPRGVHLFANVNVLSLFLPQWFWWLFFWSTYSDFCWKISTFRKSMWTQEIKLKTAQDQKSSASWSKSKLFLLSDLSQQMSDCSSSKQGERIRSSKLEMNRPRTHYILFRVPSIILWEQGRWMQPEVSFIRAQWRKEWWL
jgi:hypothetical protein